MNVPKLRFKEFNDEWQLDKICNLTSYVDYRGKTPLKVENGIFLVTAKNVKKGYIDYECSKEFVPEKDYEEIMHRGKPKIGDVLITTEAPCGNVAQINKENVALAQRIIKYRGNNNIDNTFLKYELLSDFFQSELKKVTSGGTVSGVKGSILHKMYINYCSIKEQEKIGAFLSLLDKKIELQSKKIEALKLYKLSQIRDFFKNNNFESCKLKDIGQFISSNSIGKEKITNTGVPLILYGDLYTKYNETIQDVKQFCDDNEKYVKSELNDLIFPTSTTVDAISLISPGSVKVNGAVYGGDIIIFKPNIKDINSDFLSFEINNYLKKYFSTFAQGSTIIHIQADNLLNCSVLLPNIKIQTKLANCFNLYNRKIKLEEEKLSKLESLKKGLMQNMFV